MSSQLQIFNNSEFGSVRTIEEDGKILFCGKDVAAALGYSNTKDAINRHCKGVVKRDLPHPQSRTKTLEMLFIPEGDIYRLAARSELPGAEKFERWIFDEVLPSIRKEGAYMTPDTIEKVLLNPDSIIKIAQNLKAAQQKATELENKIQADKPKVLFADAVETSHTTILVGELAKLLKQNGYETGEKRLFAWLRENGYLIKRRGADWNMPTQYSMELGLFEIKERSINEPNGTVTIKKTPKVTGKGQRYFINLFLKRKGEETA